MDYYNTSQFLTAILGAFLGAFILVLTVSLLLSVLSIIGHWKVFSKAGQPGWGAIVPFFGSYLLHKISWGNGWFFLVPLVLTFLGGLFVDSFFRNAVCNHIHCFHLPDPLQNCKGVRQGRWVHRWPCPAQLVVHAYPRLL